MVHNSVQSYTGQLSLLIKPKSCQLSYESYPQYWVIRLIGKTRHKSTSSVLNQTLEWTKSQTSWLIAFSTVQCGAVIVRCMIALIHLITCVKISESKRFELINIQNMKCYQHLASVSNYLIRNDVTILQQ